MGAALGAGKLFGLNAESLAECLSMAVVPNNALNQARSRPELSPGFNAIGERSHVLR
jgi:2-methylcitrate dehydratase PrpD